MSPIPHTTNAQTNRTDVCDIYQFNRALVFVFGRIGFERGREDDEAQTGIETEEGKLRANEKVLAAAAEKDSTDPTLTQEQRDNAGDAAAALSQGGYSYQESLNVRNNLKRAGIEYKTVLNGMIIDNGFGVLDNRILNDNPTKAEAQAHIRELRKIYMQAFIAQRRAAGDREVTRGEIRKYLAKEMITAERAVLLKWSENRNSLKAEQALERDRQEVSSIFNAVLPISEAHISNFISFTFHFTHMLIILSITITHLVWFIKFSTTILRMVY